MMKEKNTWFDVVNVALMVILIFVMVYPLWYIIVGSLNDGYDYMSGGVFFWPRKFTLANYQALFFEDAILTAFGVSVLKSLIGTITSLFVTALVSYGMTQPGLKGKNFYIAFMMFTMFFSGGIVPTFLLIKNLGLYDNFLVYILPSLFSVWNMIIIQSFLRDLPKEVKESAKIDGACEYRIFFSIILPLSKPVLAAIALFTVVGHWNSFFDAMMYTYSPELQTIQLFLRRVISDPAISNSLGTQTAQVIPAQAIQITPQTIKLAAMTVTALPVVVVYPFLQKYFVKGMTIGAIKG